VARSGLTHADWLQRVPDLVQTYREEWGLTLGEPYPPGAAGYAVRADLGDGAPAVLKLIYPHREAEHEADALEVWDGDGAVRLLARDETGWSMLIERCEPGTLLAERPADEALGVLIELLPRLWKPVGSPFRPLADEAAWWRESSGEWEVDADLRAAAEEALLELPPTQGEQVLLHQDLHGENVLAAEREPWLVIDPKPLVGEREFGLASIIRSFEFGHGAREVVHRLDRLTSELGLDPERARRWALAQTVAWSGGMYTARHVETARWLLQAE
jgi:streptomycin 6-kinase